MIISRAPLRMSLVGGGSDMPGFYREHGGAVISLAIDKYVSVLVNTRFDTSIRVAYSKTEEVASVSAVEHGLVRAGLQLAGIDGGIEIVTVADIPSRGTGLGSSSTFTVALMHALHAFRGRHSSAATLAEQACHIEIDVCREPIGKQDQYAAAYGGFNLVEFHPDDTVNVTPLVIGRDAMDRLQDSFLLLYTGMTRSASDLLRDQAAGVRDDPAKRSALKRMVALCHELRAELQSGNLEALGDLLHENWELKKSLSPKVSSGAIDDWYDTARRHGARGGKILGAGAGGFLLLTAPPELHPAICHALPGLKRFPVRFERNGSQIIFYQPAS